MTIFPRGDRGKGQNCFNAKDDLGHQSVATGQGVHFPTATKPDFERQPAHEVQSWAPIFPHSLEMSDPMPNVG